MTWPLGHGQWYGWVDLEVKFNTMEDKDELLDL